MFLVIVFFTEEGLKTGIAFLIGAFVSMICGTVGMIIATQANYRTTYCAKNSLAPAFRTAYRAGCAMGFALVSLGLLVLVIMIIVYKSYLSLNDNGSSQTYFRALF
jgi:Na+/H+-translocating membrane pyrophosphatase